MLLDFLAVLPQAGHLHLPISLGILNVLNPFGTTISCPFV
jgi:hypothetical protein